MGVLDFLNGQPLHSSTTFNWPWVVELVTCIIIVIFFLFYFNRLFATLISFALRQLLWRRLRIWVDIQAIQISFLAGRLFFKGLRYHGENETIFLQNGYITWRYWLRSTRKVDLSSDANEDGGLKAEPSRGSKDASNSSSTLPRDTEVGLVAKPNTSEARLAINVSGLEWFVYNRTPVYDAIINQNSSPTSKSNPLPAESNGSTATGVDFDSAAKSFRSRRGLSFSIDSIKNPKSDATTTKSNNRKASGTTDTLGSQSNAEHVAGNDAEITSIYSLLLGLLPVSVECSRGAISLGNENTRAIVVTTFVKAKGHIDAASAGYADIFRQLFQFDIEHPTVQMKPNPDFRRSQHAAAERIISLTHSAKSRSWWAQVISNIHRHTHRLAHRLKSLIPRSRRSVGSFRTNEYDEKQATRYPQYDGDQNEGVDWHGLDRYINDEDRDDHEGWMKVEYARFSTILDSPMVHLNFYWELPGQVTSAHLDAAQALDKQDINGISPPAYGLDLVIKGGDVNYGPWADRLRMEIQTAFIPNSYRSATPAERLKPGDWRQSTKMNIRIDIEEELTLRIPTRERSKDWQWRGRVQAVKEAGAARKQKERRHFRFRRGPKTPFGADMRPFGWLSVSVDRDSTVSYVMDMVAGKHKYQNNLQLELKNTKATSSVNHALLWRCPLQRVSGDLSNSLTWNGIQNWIFDVQSQNFEMFMLRDHMFLLTDLISDFTAGLKSEYMTFVPFNYRINLLFDDLKLYLNANDQNIIDNPCDVDENSFLILGMERLEGVVAIPLEHFSPRQSHVNFEARGQNAYLQLTTPSWNTLHTFLTENIMATLKELHLDGSYNYFTSISPELADSLMMNIEGMSPRFNLYGFLIRYFVNVKENYFGEYMHFKTLEEYQTSLDDGTPPISHDIQSNVQQENDLDVILSVRADKSCAVLPSNIYTKHELLRLDILLVEADMRFTNYYMDLQVNSSPIEASTETIRDVGQPPDITACQLFIDSVTVFGHRLFGAPPTEPPYLCNWDVDVGQILGECSTSFLRTLANSIQALVFTLDDDENALPESSTTPIYDVTFLRLRSVGGRIWLLGERAAFLFEFTKANVSLNDWVQQKFAKNVQVQIPDITIAAVELKSALRHHKNSKNAVDTMAYLHTSLRLTVLDKSENLPVSRSLQQHYLRYHDQRTHRVDWLLHTSTKPTTHHKDSDWGRIPPAMPIPMMPEPLASQYPDIARPRPTLTSSQSHSGRKSSFLSSSSSSLRKAGSQDSRQILSKAESVTHESHASGMTHTSSSSARHQAFLSRAKLGDREVPMAESTPIAFSAFTSAWAPPHFSLLGVQPDAKDTPTTDGDQVRTAANDKYDDAAESSADDMTGVAHSGLLVSIGKGLLGFCEPSALIAITDIIREMQPVSTIDLLDRLQLDVIPMVKKSFVSSKSNCTDFTLFLPNVQIKVRNSVLDASHNSLTGIDSAYLNLRDCHLTGRSMMHSPKIEEKLQPTNVFIGNAYIKSLSLTISHEVENVEGSMIHANASLTDLELWCSTQDQVRGRIQLGNLSVSVPSPEVKSIVLMAQRTIHTVEDLVEAFGHAGPNHKLQHILYHLTQSSSKVPDPIFLIRPSYVLRRSPRHVRLSTSWKAMSHLRWIYLTLCNEEAFNDLSQCTCQRFSDDETSHIQILSALEKWQGWDETIEGGNPFVTTVFGKRMKVSPDTPTALEGSMEIVIDRIELMLDSEPKQSSLVIVGVDSAIILRGGGEEPTIDTPTSNSVQKIVLQNHVAQFAINLNWGLLDLIEDVLQHTLPAEQKSSPGSSDQQVSSNIAENKEITFTFGADVVRIALATMNLKLKLGAGNLRSIVSYATSGSRSSQIAFTVAASTAKANVDNLSRALLDWNLNSPKVYGSIQQPSSGQAKTLVHVGAACHMIRFKLKDDIIDVLQVVQLVIKDEVRTVHNLLQSIPQQDLKGSASAIESTQEDKIQIHLAMFLDSYRLRFLLTPFLFYEIAGKVARTSLIPQQHGQFRINFDLKRQEHTFKNSFGGSENHSSLLRVPPINGRILIGRSGGLTTVRAHTALEQIMFEAAAVRVCFDTLNQPGLLRTVNNIKPQVDQIQASVAQLFGSSELNKTNSSGPDVQFAVHATLAGLGIHCSAPAIQSEEYRADLTFRLGATSVYLHNKAEEQGKLQDRPQFLVRIREIAINIDKKTKYDIVNFGSLKIGVQATGVAELDAEGKQVQAYRASSSELKVELFEETASLVLDVAAFLQERIKTIQLPEEAKRMPALRRFTVAGIAEKVSTDTNIESSIDDPITSTLLGSVYSLNLNLIQVRWRLHGDTLPPTDPDLEDLVFSIRKIDFQTRRENAALLSFLDLQLQIVPRSMDPLVRTANSALLPEVIFSAAYFPTKEDRRFAFQAKGKALDLRLSSDFILPASALKKSLTTSVTELRQAEAWWATTPQTSQKKPITLLGTKRLASLQIDADFAGAVVNITPRREEEQQSSVFGILKGSRRSRIGRYGQVMQSENAAEAMLQAPGIALKVEFRDNGQDDPNLNLEVKVAGSSNTLYPSVVPLILEVSASVKEMLGESKPAEESEETKSQKTSYLSDAAMNNGDPAAILGRCRLNAGLWIQRQAFSLSCQPIARVAATAKFDDIFLTVNTVQSSDHGRFFSILTTFNNLHASVQHVYSRESTASFEVDSIVISLMNSRHVSSTVGISAILNISPMKTDINAKQLQDFLLFREIWYPAELRQASKAPAPAPTASETQTYAIQRYQQLAASAVLPWSAVVSVQELKLQVDLGPSLGKSLFTISKLWAFSKKNSDSKQNLCIGFDKIGIDSTGRMSGFIELQNFRVRTSIRWPHETEPKFKAPLVQGSIGFDHLRVKAVFDYQPFAVADISTFEFLMYNVRQASQHKNDRLVGILNGGKVQAFCTASTAAQGVALVQAFEKLVQEKQEAYQASLGELDKFLRRRSVFPTSTWTGTTTETDSSTTSPTRGIVLLHTDVVVNVKEVDIGAFPSTFFDTQILKIEATDAQARFAVATTDGKTQCDLGMALGQVRVALSGVSRPNTKALGEVSVNEVIDRATSSKGGTILRVPRLVSSMRTQQWADSNVIEYIFKSIFEGKVDVGWNYSRISYIRNMWQIHSRALAQRLGKPLPPSAVKITAEPPRDGPGGGQEKITAMVNVPQSKFRYVALEPPIIDTPQLRDMGEATPPLEWIGLHRDKLPEATHSIAIVTLLEVAKEVEDAYTRILGST